MTECQCRFCYEEYQVPSQVRFCEERHLKMIQSIPPFVRIGLSELKMFIGGELTARIEKAVLGTLQKDHIKGRIRWRWENPNLQDIPVLISLGIPPQLLEQIERVERECEMNYTLKGRKKTWSRLRLQGLSNEPEKVIAKLLM